MNEPKTLEGALTELERIVQELEGGETGLEKSLERYEQGVGLLRHCFERLRNAEQRIVELTGKDESGNPMLRPFEHESAVKRVP